MGEHKEGRDWPPAETKFCYFFIFSYTKLNCSSWTKFRFLLEITVSKLYKILCQMGHFLVADKSEIAKESLEEITPMRQLNKEVIVKWKLLATRKFGIVFNN